MSVIREERGAPGWAGLALWLGLQLIAPTPTAAQTVTGAARVTTSVDACVPIELEQFQRVLAIELGTSIEFSRFAAQAPNGTVIQVSCRGSDIELQLNDSLTRKSMQRLVELPQVSVAARTRLLALAVAEFVVASWVELQLAPAAIEPLGPPAPPEAARQASELAQARLPPPQPAAVQRPVSLPLPRPPPPYATRWQAAVSIEPLAFARGAGFLGQLSVHGQQRPAEHLALCLALSLAHGAWPVRWSGTDQERAQLTATSGRIGAAYVTSIGALELLAGLAVRLGVVHMAGESHRLELRAGELYAPWGGPTLHLAAAARWEHARIGIEFEAGYVTLPVQALINGSVVAELGGVWGAVGLMAGWLF